MIKNFILKEAHKEGVLYDGSEESMNDLERLIKKYRNDGHVFFGLMSELAYDQIRGDCDDNSITLYNSDKTKKITEFRIKLGYWYLFTESGVYEELDKPYSVLFGLPPKTVWDKYDEVKP